MNAIRTSHQIRGALGSNYRRLVNLYDIKTRERNATTKKVSKKCAACGRPPTEGYSIQAAHISPLSECAITVEGNLLPLCKEQSGNPELGCHTLFDQGYCSILDMYECRKRWIAGLTPTTRSQMLQMRADYGPRPQQLGYLKVELGNLRSKQKFAQNDSEEWHIVQIQITEITRRRARKDALRRALKEIVKVNPECLHSDYLKARYFYEKAYIELLSGHLNEAFSDFLEGRNILEANIYIPENAWRFAAHTSLLAQTSCIMRFFNTESGWSWKRLHEELTKSLSYAQMAVMDFKRAMETDASPNLREEYRHARRWVLNCQIHLIKPYIAVGDLGSAFKCCNKVYENWESMDISNGWDAGFRTSLLSLYGQLLLKSAQNPDEIDNALAYLVRSLVLLIGLRRQQPEGIRDLLFSIADALKYKNDSMHKFILATASDCMDFSSWFNPYVPKPLVDTIVD